MNFNFAISGSGASGSTSGAGDRLATTDPKSVVRQHGGPVVGDGSSNDTTFYITLTIEQDDDDDDPLERIDNSGKAFNKYVHSLFRPNYDNRTEKKIKRINK